jgi:dTDP-4-amino-4,6-dideoxygalactose transaminase
MEGYNGRLDAIQAGILYVKLGHLDCWNESRRESASRYQELLSPLAGEIGLPWEPSWAKGVYHLYTVRSRNRDRLQEYLASIGIGTGIHYPIPLHLQNAYRYLGYRPEDFPIAERAAAEMLSLPLYVGLRFDHQYRVAESLRAFVSSGYGAHAAAAAV